MGIARFDLRNELRSGIGLASLSLFLLGVTAAFVFGSTPDMPSPTVAAGTLTALTALTSYLAVTRSFLSEVERGTFATLRNLADSRSIFLGKLLSSIVQAGLGVLIVSVVYVVGVGLIVEDVAILILSLFALTLSMTVAMLISAAVGSVAQGKWVLVGAAGLPLILPLVFSGVSAIRPAFGFGVAHWQYPMGILGYGALFAALGVAVAPHLLRGRDRN